MPRYIPKDDFNNNFLLIGANHNAIPYLSNIRTTNALPHFIIDPVSYVGDNSITLSKISTSDGRSQSKIKLVSETSKEMADIMGGYYGGVSIMSLDGLLSPVSFYPSNWASTFSTTLYSRSDCPWCTGIGIYTVTRPQTDIMSWPNTISYNTVCPFCTTDAVKEAQAKKTVTLGKEIEPPHIITDANDNSTTIKDIKAGNEYALVNRFTLNPIVMKTGEFSNPDNRQKGDTSAHCIDIVGCGLSPPGDGESVRSLVSDTSDNFISDYNQRFMALRGPLMLHSWGYDIAGYPVPNQSTEFKLDAAGNIMRDTNGNVLYATQEQDSQGNWGPVKPSYKFKKGWAQRAQDWPVGPIDLRWDAAAGVWTIGANYKNVWITIETDLTVKNTVVRGAIYQEGPTTLPDGKRKVVFVKDTLGVVSAPRKASIYCKYDQDSGFYQPLYASNLTAIGDIVSSTSVEIETSYSIDSSQRGSTYTTTFENPLALSTQNATKGIFNFINGDWVLVNTD